MPAAIGSGERTFTNIARAAGGIGAAPLQRALELLADKRIVAVELPVSLCPSKDRRYRVADPHLRFWLHLLGPCMEEIERGRGDLAVARIRENWTSRRSRAVELLVREALARILPDDRLPAVPAVGGYWTRTDDVEIDVVGANCAPVAEEPLFVGSSSGWSGRPSTGTTWQPSTDTGPHPPANPSRSWRSRAAESTAQGSMPPTVPVIC